jgi:hypothetical protein
MQTYWCRILDQRGHAICAERIAADDDAAAIAKAFTLFGGRPAYAYEIMDRDRMVHREELGGK